MYEYEENFRIIRMSRKLRESRNIFEKLNSNLNSAFSLDVIYNLNDYHFKIKFSYTPFIFIRENLEKNLDDK